MLRWDLTGVVCEVVGQGDFGTGFVTVFLIIGICQGLPEGLKDRLERELLGIRNLGSVAWQLNVQLFSIGLLQHEPRRLVVT